MEDSIDAKSLFTDAQLRGCSQPTLLHLAAGARRGGRYQIKKRVKLAMRQDWCCYWCNQLCCEDLGYMNSATIEHVVPKCLDGPNDAWNLVMACYRCNNLRSQSQNAEAIQQIDQSLVNLKPDQRHMDRVKIDQARYSYIRGNLHRIRADVNRQNVIDISWTDRLWFAACGWMRTIPA